MTTEHFNYYCSPPNEISELTDKIGKERITSKKREQGKPPPCVLLFLKAVGYTTKVVNDKKEKKNIPFSQYHGEGIKAQNAIQRQPICPGLRCIP